MTREEGIKQKALKLYPIKEKENKKATGTYDANLQRRKAFEEGAKWADKTMIDMEGVYANNEINCYHQDFGDKVRIRLGGDFEIKVEGKITYIVKKRPEYPKTYEECCKILFPNTIELGKVSAHGYKGKLLENLGELLICRDAYWKIAGEQIGLGEPWRPELNSKKRKFALSNVGGNISFEIYGEYNSILCFPTEEMRDAFFENFKDLIEECKELL